MKVLKTCRIDKELIEYCTMQQLNFNGLTNHLLHEFVKQHQRSASVRRAVRLYPKDFEVDIFSPEELHEP